MPRDKDLTLAQAQDLARYYLGDEWVCSYGGSDDNKCIVAYTVSYSRIDYADRNWRAAFRAAGVDLPVRSRFTAHGRSVMRDASPVATAVTPTTAARIANALNAYIPSRRGT